MAKYGKNYPVATPRGVAVWPKLSAPDYAFNPEGMYRADIRVRKDDPAFLEFQARLEEIAEDGREKTGSRGKCVFPFYDDKDRDGNIDPETILIRASQKAEQNTRTKGETVAWRPKIVATKIKDGQPTLTVLDPPPSIGGGSELTLSCRAVPMEVSGVYRVKLYLEAVLIHELVEGRVDPLSQLTPDAQGYTVPGEEVPF